MAWATTAAAPLEHFFDDGVALGALRTRSCRRCNLGWRKPSSTTSKANSIPIRPPGTMRRWRQERATRGASERSHQDSHLERRAIFRVPPRSTDHPGQPQTKHARERRMDAQRREICVFGVAEWNAYPHAELNDAWKKVLFNQFHDLAAGSGIGVIYKDAQKDYDEVRRATNEVSTASLHRFRRRSIRAEMPACRCGFQSSGVESIGGCVYGSGNARGDSPGRVRTGRPPASAAFAASRSRYPHQHFAIAGAGQRCPLVWLWSGSGSSWQEGRADGFESERTGDGELVSEGESECTDRVHHQPL